MTSRREALLRLYAGSAEAYAGELGPEPLVGRVLDSLPEATADDFGDPFIRPEALATPDGWREWLAELTGGQAILADETSVFWVPETNFMRRAKAGDTTGGYVKTGEVRSGCAVWEKQGG